MGNPRWSYDEMCRKAYWLLNHNHSNDIDEIENYIENHKKDKDFYFNAGIAAGQVSEDILQNGCIDEVNAMVGGFSAFCGLVGVDEDD